MTNGTLPESAAYLIGGILFLFAAAAVVLKVIKDVRDMRAQSIYEKESIAAKAADELAKAKSEYAVAIEVAKAEASKETASKMAFEQLTSAVKAMDDTVGKLSKGVGDRIDGIKTDHELLCRRVDRIADSTRSAHKRMDEHRKVDHSFTNGHYVEPDEDPEESPL